MAQGLSGSSKPIIASTRLQQGTIADSCRFNIRTIRDATGISTEGMQKIAREFNFPESTFVLPKNEPANSYRVRIFTPRAELNFA
jgi:hypothetical protein